jgi:hypothetical protein
MSSSPDIVVHIHLQRDSHFSAVLSALMALSAQTPAVSTGAQAPPPPAPPADYVPGSPWGLARLEWLHRISWSMQHAIVTCIANASINDTVATRQQLLTATTAEVKQPQTTKNLAANLAWISRYAFTVTGHKKGPFTEKDLGVEYPEGERYTYAMDKSDAQAWLEIMARKK